jgi:purine-binding chemotaxis protein CheW
MDRMLFMSLGGQRFGLELKCLRELVAFEGLTQVPGVPRWFAGLAVVRSELVAVVDLALLLRNTPTDLEAVTKLVVLGTGQPEFACLAEAAEELGIIDERNLRAAPPSFRHCPFVRGATSDGLIVLDGSALLEDRRIYA